MTNPLSVTADGVSLDSVATSGFDIGREVRNLASNAPATSGLGYAILTKADFTATLYEINLATGAATTIENAEASQAGAK